MMIQRLNNNRTAYADWDEKCEAVDEYNYGLLEAENDRRDQVNEDRPVHLLVGRSDRRYIRPDAAIAAVILNGVCC